MEYLSLWIVLGCCVVGFIGSTAMCNSIAKSTGADLTGGILKKLIMVAGCIGVILLATCIGSPEELGSQLKKTVLIGSGTTVGSLAILFLHNKTAVKPLTALILSVFQILYGMLVFVTVIVKLILKMMDIQFGSSSSSSGGSSTLTQFDNAIRENARKHNEQLKRENNERAESYAQSIGFDNADEADSYGMRTGKED